MKNQAGIARIILRQSVEEYGADGKLVSLKEEEIDIPTAKMRDDELEDLRRGICMGLEQMKVMKVMLEKLIEVGDLK